MHTTTLQMGKIQAQASLPAPFPFGRGNSVFSPQSKVVLDFPKHSQGITPSRNSSNQSEPVQTCPNSTDQVLSRRAWFVFTLRM